MTTFATPQNGSESEPSVSNSPPEDSARVAASGPLRRLITSLTSISEMSSSGSSKPSVVNATKESTESRLFTMASPLFTRRMAAEYPIPFGRYKGVPIATVASQPIGVDYLEEMAMHTEIDFVADMICLYLGYCPLAIRPTATNEIDETDNF
jgi:hypothetical protein